MLLLLIALILLFGAGIGATGIGGVGVVPALVGFAGEPVDRAIPVAQAAFVVTGLVGAAMHRREMAGLDREVVRLMMWSAGGAVAGAMLMPLIAGVWLEVALGVLMAAVGVFEIVRRSPRSLPTPGARPRANPPFRIVGCGVGLGSALTGTGGPILFVPAMLLAGADVRRTVALAQLIQVPIAGAGTAVHVARGALDLRLTAAVGAALALGVVAGALIARRLSVEGLRIVLAGALVAGGAAFLVYRI